MTPPAEDPGAGRALKIVLTGGPGGGKTTAADLFRRELGARVAVVPEAATVLFAGGFPRKGGQAAQRAAQRAIYHVQRNIEEVKAELHRGRVLLCDRGTVDGAAYWPAAPGGFFEAVGSSLEAELARYDAVVFFQSAAVGGLEINGGNPIRTESTGRAAELDAALHALWSRHPRFVLVPHTPSFIAKITHGLAELQRIVAEVEAAGRAG